MKMGPSAKVVAPTQARVQADDQARTIQYDPEMTEGGEPSGDMKLSEEEIQSLMKAEVHDASRDPVVQQGHKGQDGFRLWVCDKCGHELSVSSTEHRPDPIRWTDGHICYFHQAKEEGEGIGAEPLGIGEAGIGAVQHSSMRTVGNGGNLPQDPDTRWADDLDEVTKKVSKALKTIQKGQKGKKTKKNPKLKFQPTKHTTSGVHKRKTK